MFSISFWRAAVRNIKNEQKEAFDPVFIFAVAWGLLARRIGTTRYVVWRLDSYDLLQWTTQLTLPYFIHTAGCWQHGHVA